jgi:hypothetical protein
MRATAVGEAIVTGSADVDARAPSMSGSHHLIKSLNKKRRRQVAPPFDNKCEYRAPLEQHAQFIGFTHNIACLILHPNCKNITTRRR